MLTLPRSPSRWLSRWRKSMSGPASIVAVTRKCGISRLAWVRRCAMVRRVGVSGRSSYSSVMSCSWTAPGRTTASAVRPDSAASSPSSASCSTSSASACSTSSCAPSSWPPSAAPRTSRSTMRPPGPLPLTWRRSTPSSMARLLASGEASSRPGLAAAGRARPPPFLGRASLLGALARAGASSASSASGSSLARAASFLAAGLPSWAGFFAAF